MISGTALFLGLFNNLAILIVLVAVYGVLNSYFEKTARHKRQFVVGFAFGLFAIGCMYVKIPVAEGVIVDQRNTIVALSGGFGGPLAAVLCVLMSGTYRIYLGGAGVVGGVIGICLSAVAGVIFYKLRNKIDSVLRASLSALAATIIILPGFLFCGNLQTGWSLLKAMALPYGLAIFLGLLFVGLLLAHEEHGHIAKAEKRKSEKRYRKLFESLIDVSYRTDSTGDIVLISPSSERILGYRPEELIGKQIRNFYRDPVRRDEFIAQARRYGRVENFETEIRKKDGTFIWVSTNAKLLTNDEGSFIGIEGITRDISRLKETENEKYKLEEQLKQSQKMEAMGLLAGGVAHDLNNILSGIVSYPELLLMDLPEDSPLRKPIKTIQESGMRAADVVDDLLTVARGVATGKEVLNLNTIVSEYLESPEYQELDKAHSFVNFQTELDSDLLNMRGSPIHIKKILMNLVRNASEAIKGAGTVTISSMNRYLDEPLNGYTGIRTGEYAVLSVSDDGSGITPKDLERIFEPFYTKKVMGRSGTGLGLAVVWNTVQDHNGYINVQSSKKETAFELYFPVTRKEVSDEKEKIPFENYLGHGEKILVVDDEERQREIACGMLTKLGYNAEAVSSGEEAIEYLKEKQVDLIVLDMVMPKGINGRKTYEEIIKICPGQKAIIASGFSESEEVKMAQKSGAGNYIKKPYILEKIGLSVKEELEK